MEPYVSIFFVHNGRLHWLFLKCYFRFVHYSAILILMYERKKNPKNIFILWFSSRIHWYLILLEHIRPIKRNIILYVQWWNNSSCSFCCCLFRRRDSGRRDMPCKKNLRDMIKCATNNHQEKRPKFASIETQFSFFRVCLFVYLFFSSFFFKLIFFSRMCVCLSVCLNEELLKDEQKRKPKTKNRKD